MSFTVVIPARYGSTRLSGKPLVDIAGKTMVQRVYEQALLSSADRVIIATDDQRVYDRAHSFNAEVLMTSASHESGTDRLQEVVSQLALPDEHIVVNVQGDEPLIPPSVINQVAASLASNNEAGIATLYETIADFDSVFNPNVVKLTVDQKGRALYFSRAPIPWARDQFSQTDAQPGSQSLSVTDKPKPGRYKRHIGIYAYRVSLLHDFVNWSPSDLELTERLEQLRAMENGIAIMAVEACEAIPGGIDTQQDLDAIRNLFQLNDKA